MAVPAVSTEAAPTRIDTQPFRGHRPDQLSRIPLRIDAAGELKRITAKVDPIEEMSVTWRLVKSALLLFCLNV
jgi:hypothetical protein